MLSCMRLPGLREVSVTVFARLLISHCLLSQVRRRPAAVVRETPWWGSGGSRTIPYLPPALGAYTRLSKRT